MILACVAFRDPEGCTEATLVQSFVKFHLVSYSFLCGNISRLVESTRDKFWSRDLWIRMLCLQEVDVFCRNPGVIILRNL